MRSVFLSRLTICIFWILVVLPAARAGEPTDQIRQTTEKAITVLTDPHLKDPNMKEERRKLLRQIADERFDWEEMARRALARHWAERTEDEKREFISLFSQLLDRTYMDRVDNYSGERVIYEGDKVEGDYGIVRVKIVTSNDNEIPAEYRVRKKGNAWLIYDISIQGVSLINNYRSQFNSIIIKSSYQDLVKRLKAKLNSP